MIEYWLFLLSEKLRWNRVHNPQISFLVPFRADRNQMQRIRNWQWLRRYWEESMPGAEIIIGQSSGEVFSKTEAVNDAASRATGRIFVILDADAYMDASVIQKCADDIELAQERGHARWFIPYRALYRLTEVKSAQILKSDPHRPVRLSSPPKDSDVESKIGSMHGRRYGAMIQIMSREAFEKVGGMDPRFRGWGGEDISFARALDTLYGKHKTTNNDVLHIWHPKFGENYHTRIWAGQSSGEVNKHLATRYSVATGDRDRMRALVDEGFSNDVSTEV
jgi:hypothetical protein